MHALFKQMNPLQELFQAEKEKDYAKFIKLADRLLRDHSHTHPEKIIEITSSRRNYYKKLLANSCNRNKCLSELLQFTSHSDKKMLEKCCPSAKRDFANTRTKDEITPASAQSHNGITDAYITGNKDLLVSREEQASEKLSIGYYQMLLSSTLKITPLNFSSTHASQSGINDIISLDNEFMPIALVLRDTDSSKISRINWLAFPSALRGGYHFAEVVDKYGELGAMEANYRFTQEMISEERGIRFQYLITKPDNYNLGLGYCNEQFRKWLTKVHNITLLQSSTSAPKANVLHLPQKTYPTIASLLNGTCKANEEETIYSTEILAVSESDYTPLYKLSAAFAVDSNKRNIQQDILPYPYIYHNVKTISAKETHTPNPLCIMQANNRAPLALHPPNDPTREDFNAESPKGSYHIDITIVSKIEDSNSITEEFILGIAHQKNVRVKKIVFIAERNGEKAVRSRFQEFSGRWQLPFQPEYVHKAIDAFKSIDSSTYLLVINPYICMQNPHILQLLSENLTRYSSFSSSCILSHLQTAKKKEIYDNVSAGMYLSLNHYSQTGRIMLEAKNLTSSLLPTDIKVLSNHYDFALYNTDLLAPEIGNCVHTEDIRQFLINACCRQAISGKHNVCSTRICSTYISSPTPNNSIILDRAISRYIINNLNRVYQVTTNIVDLLA